MESMENKEILDKLNELLALIEQDVAVQEFKEIEKQVEQCSEIQSFIQKMSTQAYYHRHEKNREMTRKQVENLHNMLDDHPFVKEYLEKTWEANDLVQHVISLLEEEIRKQIER